MLAGSSEYLSSQYQIIKKRPLVNATYLNWYTHIANDFASAPKGILLELGSGGGFLKEIVPPVITSDVVDDGVDMIIDAQKLPFESSQLSGIAMTHSFHHVPEVRKFLEEAVRTLKPGGVISLIEVAHTPFAKFFFQHFHPEPYRDEVKEWIALEVPGARWKANQALSWNILFRDQEVFKSEFPKLVVEEFNYLPWLGYLLSGGVTKPNLVPNWAVPIVKGIQWLCSPLNSLFVLHWHIRIRRVD